MTRQTAGARLLGAGGVMIFVAGFVPFGHARSHAGEIGGPWDALTNPSDALSWPMAVYYGASVVGLGYPFAVGALLAASAALGRFRAFAIASFLLHTLTLWTLTVATIALATPTEATPTDGGKARPTGLLLAGSAVLASLLVAECEIAVRSPRRLKRRITLIADRVNLIPTLFLVIVNAALYFSLKHKAEQWPVSGYPVGFLGAALGLAGLWMRSSPLR